VCLQRRRRHRVRSEQLQGCSLLRAVSRVSCFVCAGVSEQLQGSSTAQLRVTARRCYSGIFADPCRRHCTAGTIRTAGPPCARSVVYAAPHGLSYTCAWACLALCEHGLRAQLAETDGAVVAAVAQCAVLVLWPSANSKSSQGAICGAKERSAAVLYAPLTLSAPAEGTRSS
jgi:hypothetical protein